MAIRRSISTPIAYRPGRQQGAVSRLLAAFAVVAALCVTSGALVSAQPLPPRISDREFWAMVEDFSEPGGSFVTDNIISNEIAFQQVIPDLQKRQQQDAYLGVGPEQNFTYVTALRPKIAFIIDIRRQNLLLHLLYKALAEISVDRADFMSRLFARERPAGAGADTTVRSLFAEYAAMPVSEERAAATLHAVVTNLKRTHNFPLSHDDERGIALTYRTLYTGGPDLRGDFGGGPWIPSYAELMRQTDWEGYNHGYLASEENFAVFKEYQEKNLIVPLVGDFAGDRTIRAVGRYLKEHKAIVTTFYTSNVEEYLFRSNSWTRFVDNVAALPVNDRSTFVRAYFTHTQAGLRSLLDSIPGVINASGIGNLRTYTDVVLRSKSPRR
jgi:hypothetical protein